MNIEEYDGHLPPDGWELITLAEVCEVERGITFPASVKSSQGIEGTIACLRTTNVQDTVVWDDLIYVPKYYVKNEYKLLRQNDILISMANSRELVGKVSFVDHIPVESSFGGFISVIRSSETLHPRFLFYYLRLGSTRERLRKAAVEGKLTEAWRAEHPTTEPASILLERILKERRDKWEADLKTKGKDPAKVNYVEPAKPDTENLPELPEGWCWATVEQVSQCIVDCLHSTPNFKESGFLCIDTNCIKPGRIVVEKVRYVDEDTFIERNRRMKPKENDVMFSREGALLGVSVRVPSNLEFCLGQRMMIFRLDQCIDASFYEKVLNSSVFRSQYIHEITGSASPHLNIQDIRRFMIPLPPFFEQQFIVAEVESRLSIVEKLESVIEANLKRAERLRQSILKEAFAGRLVPQDSNDEPASVLLERIRKEREGRKKGATGNGRYIKVSSEPVQIDVEGTRQVELWEGVGSEG